MENIALNSPIQELNKTLSNDSSEQKNQVIGLVDLELLDDEDWRQSAAVM